MATTAVEAASRLSTHFRVGKKKIYLPNHVVAMMRPNKTLAPRFAAFKVPLSFNKLDLRDYLWHAYNVRVLSVRSMVKQQALASKGNMRGQTYRPLSQKMMIAELDKPFVWPEVPAEDAREAFDYKMWSKVEEERQDHLEQRRTSYKGEIPLRTQVPVPADRNALAATARAILEGRQEWKPTTKLDDIWETMPPVARLGLATGAKTRFAKTAAGKDGEKRRDDVEIIHEDDKP